MISLAFSIRPAERDDIPAIGLVHRDSVASRCSRHYTSAQLDAWFQDRPPDMYVKAVREHRVWIACDDRDVLGFLEIRPGEIEKLFVRGRAAGQGIGSALLRVGLERLRDTSRGTIIALALLNARTFYERHGFIKVGESSITRSTADLSIAVLRMELEAADTA